MRTEIYKNEFNLIITYIKLILIELMDSWSKEELEKIRKMR